MTLARTRLFLGITGVGMTVLLAASALALGLPARWLSSDPAAPLLHSLRSALLWPLVWTALLLPLDLCGGLVAVRHRPPLRQWLREWLRGVLVQWAVLAVSGSALLLLSRALGLFGAVMGSVVIAVVIASQIGNLARGGASLDLESPDPQVLRAARISPGTATMVTTADEGFVGGYGGVLRPHLWIPSSWATLPRSVAEALLVRRRLAAQAPRIRGLGLAWVWLALGALCSGIVFGVPDSAAGLVSFSLGTTLWAFLGVLVLPTPSRRAVMALDQAAANAVGQDNVAAAITALDRWQDDEPSRHALIEAIFHPVPARNTRLRSLGASAPSGSGAWRPARLALPLGLATWSLLGRAVHCNIGRPALWWFLPGD